MKEDTFNGQEVITEVSLNLCVEEGITIPDWILKADPEYKGSFAMYHYLCNKKRN